MSDTNKTEQIKPQVPTETQIQTEEKPKQKSKAKVTHKRVESQGEKAVRLNKERQIASKKAQDEFEKNQAEYDTAVQLASQYNGNPENLSKGQISIIRRHIPNILRKEHQ